MQGIPFSDYKTLHQRLDELLETAEKTGGPDDLALAQQYKQSLSDIYAQYSSSIQNVSEQTKRFSSIKINIRQMLIKQRKKLKQLAPKT